MAYDLTNLQNVTNYLSQQQQGGNYVPTNGSLGRPSMGWDGWNGYNASQTYNPAQTTPAPQSPMIAPAGNPNVNRDPSRPMNSQGPGPGWQPQQHMTGAMKHSFQGGFPVGGGGASVNNTAQSPMSAPSNIMTGGAARPLSQTLQGVQDYGNQYGQNAYQFTPGINDYQSKLASWQQLAKITGQSVEDVAQQVSGYSPEYWQHMQALYDQNQHPTTTTADPSTTY